MKRIYQYFIPLVLNYSDKNEQHKINPKQLKLHRVKHVQLTANWQKKLIFLTTFQLPHLTWVGETGRSRHGGGGGHWQGGAPSPDMSWRQKHVERNQICIQSFKWKRIDPNENDLGKLTREMKEMKTAQQHRPES